MSPIMVSLLNPFPLISFQAPCASPDVGVLSWNQFPRKTLKWKALFQPLCTKLDCVLVSRGVVCFCRVSLCRKVKWAGLAVSWAAFCHRLFMGIPPQMGTVKSLGYSLTVDIRIQGCSLSAKWHFSAGSSRESNWKKRNLCESAQREAVKFVRS